MGFFLLDFSVIYVLGDEFGGVRRVWFGIFRIIFKGFLKCMRGFLSILGYFLFKCFELGV